MSARQRILVVEDDPMTRQAIVLTLEHDGYEVLEADSAATAELIITTQPLDLIVLDLELPDVSGFEFCRTVRSLGRDTPILILSGRDTEIDVVVGLELGADDYITKPFRPRELLARVATRLRRPPSSVPVSSAQPLRFRDLVIDPAQRRVFRGPNEVHVTYTEFEILHLLATRSGQAVSRDTILHAVWTGNRIPEPRIIDVHVRNLRAKLEDVPSRPAYIIAVPGVGYRFPAISVHAPATASGPDPVVPPA